MLLRLWRTGAAERVVQGHPIRQPSQCCSTSSHSSSFRGLAPVAYADWSTLCRPVPRATPMSRRSKLPKTHEEQRLLARSQMAEASAVLLRATSRLAVKLRFESVRLTSESPFAAAHLANSCLTIEFLYGPPDFHVEMFLSHHRRPNSRLSLSKLIEYPPVRAWLEARPSGHEPHRATRIESEVDEYGELLSGPCAEVFTAPERFFSRFPLDGRNASPCGGTSPGPTS